MTCVSCSRRLSCLSSRIVCFWPFWVTRCSIAEETRNMRREPERHSTFPSTLLSQSQSEHGWSGLNLATASAKKDSTPKSSGGIAQQSQTVNPVLTALRDPVRSLGSTLRNIAAPVKSTVIFCGAFAPLKMGWNSSSSEYTACVTVSHWY